ncbi:uncharacterized protein CBL_00181 [Carabus blaptoides fortunei]
MPTNALLFTLFYLLVSVGIVYPPVEFISAGLTIPTLFASKLCSENEKFIQYHMQRTVLTLCIHSALPFLYTLLMTTFYNFEELLIYITLIAPSYVLYQIYYWSQNDWLTHPIALNLTNVCNPDTGPDIISYINAEYRRIDKICIQTNSVVRVIVTDNWLIKVTPYNVYFAFRNNTSLIVTSSDTHTVSVSNQREVQYINIQVKSSLPHVQPFYIRLNALDFKDLQDKWLMPITVLPSVTFHRTLLDRFVDAFKEQINFNAKYETSQELESCIGCMQTIANVKLQKLCVEDPQVHRDPEQVCTSCSCRPMWCADCMARWFASRLDESVPDTWLASKCTCPMCRSKFCIFDVSMIQNPSAH